jgi:hypothetical protein
MTPIRSDLAYRLGCDVLNQVRSPRVAGARGNDAAHWGHRRQMSRATSGQWLRRAFVDREHVNGLR